MQFLSFIEKQDSRGFHYLLHSEGCLQIGLKILFSYFVHALEISCWSFPFSASQKHILFSLHFWKQRRNFHNRQNVLLSCTFICLFYYSMFFAKICNVWFSTESEAFIKLSVTKIKKSHAIQLRLLQKKAMIGMEN